MTPPREPDESDPLAAYADGDPDAVRAAAPREPTEAEWEAARRTVRDRLARPPRRPARARPARPPPPPRWRLRAAGRAGAAALVAASVGVAWVAWVALGRA